METSARHAHDVEFEKDRRRERGNREVVVPDSINVLLIIGIKHPRNTFRCIVTVGLQRQIVHVKKGTNRARGNCKTVIGVR